MLFRPINASSKTIAATSTSSSTALDTQSKPTCLLVQTLAASSECFIRIGAGAQTALTTDMVILPGVTYYIPLNLDVETHIGAICSATETATLYITNGYARVGQ